MDESTRFEHMRSIEDPHIRALLYDNHQRTSDLEADQRLRQVAISILIGAGPMLGVFLGIISGVKVSF
jgi:hypothetical protein